MARKSSTTKRKRFSAYSNLSHKRKTKKDAAARKKAEYLASLPKHPVKRFFYRLHPKRVAKFWFSKRGLVLAAKILGVILLIGLLFAGSLFAYFRKDLDQIRPGELAKRVQTSVTTYYDRNGELLWEDRGIDNYRVVVESDQISDHLKQATVAIEDRDFYDHHGVSISGTSRALVHNVTNREGTVQGGSTLTQQLVKQVFFADEAEERGIAGVPRKIKEAILAIEVERMYDKDQILTLYLNESPYGGRRNGAESAAQTYFAKSAAELTLAEAALIAGIPQNPSLYDPYNTGGHEILVGRQHTTLDYMAREGFITQEEADEAKEVPILDQVRPITDQYEDVKAPHFVQMVRSQLEEELGATTVGQGGLKVTTTLDVRIQDKLEEEMQAFFASGIPESNNIHNSAATIEDVNTGQIVALMGSRDFMYPGFGQDNAATSFIQPGSTVKPLVFAKLLENKGNDTQNFGSGTVLSDERIDDIYGARLNNWDNRFMGDITIRSGLALSRNIPAVKAMEISGVDETLNKIHELGASSYCEQERAGGVGLASAIGGCGSRQVEFVNAYGTLARGGVHKPTTTVLKVENSSGETIKQYEENEERVLDPQIPYILSDILSDPQARSSLHGPNPPGLHVPGVRVAGKTGTSNLEVNGRVAARDLWINTYSPALSMGMWLGNSDMRTLGTSNSVLGGPVVSNVMEWAHKNVYAQEDKWSDGDWFERPDGIQQQGNELYPSWWNRNQSQRTEELTFDRVSRYRATDCTPEGARVEVEVRRSTDPVTNREIFIAPDGYDATREDDRHDCNDQRPSVDVDFEDGHVVVTYSRGTFGLRQLEVRAGGNTIRSVSVGSNGTQRIPYNGRGNVTATITDEGYYTSSDSGTPPRSSSGSGSDDDDDD